MTPTKLDRLKSVSTNSVSLREGWADTDVPEFAPYTTSRADALGDSLHGALYRPYIDLTKDGEVAVHADGVLLAYDHLVTGRTRPDWLQQLHPPAFRSLLAHSLGSQEIAHSDPSRALAGQTSPRVAVVLDYVRDAARLPARELYALTKLLAALGFYRYVLTGLPKPVQARWESDADWAACAYAFFSARANYATSYSLGSPARRVAYWPRDLIGFHGAAPRGSRARLDAAMRLCVFAGKILRNRDLVHQYARAAKAEFATFEDDGSFHHRLLASKYLRAVSFEPMVDGDRDELRRVLDEAESHARALEPRDDSERLLKRDNLMILLETRTREAQWNHDLDKAEELVTHSTAMNPLDPMRHSVRGEVLAQRGKWGQAAAAFERAAALGPPLTPMAWYMAGQCRERLGEPDTALSHYFACVQVDPGAVSAYRGIVAMASRCGFPAMASRAEAVLHRLMAHVPTADLATADATVPERK
ncbi:tetratricopeptide repeat protein [Streptomyces sp. NPDC007851]|uniref:tetratricopeptide repeat protein n=1 Tax=Streptomyces sp. NPDC007851 TaxID=3155008 RepID=UPI0033E26FC2